MVGDDIKSQVGATIVHRMLAKLFADRGVALDRTYQLNTGGNTDFLNMLNRARTGSKRRSKTEAVQSVLPQPLPRTMIHIGPSDYVPWQRDNKVVLPAHGGAWLRQRADRARAAALGRGQPELRRLRHRRHPLLPRRARSRRRRPAAERRGVPDEAPPQQLTDDLAKEQVERFLRGEVER